MSALEDGPDGPIDFFLFKQPAAEFNLKLLPPAGDWSADVAPRSSLLVIGQKLALAMVPSSGNGALRYFGINNLSQKTVLPNKLNELKFCGDESHVLAMTLCSDEQYLFVAKGSQSLYTVKLHAANHLEVLGSIKLSQSAVALTFVKDCGLAVLLENGQVQVHSNSTASTGVIDDMPAKCFVGPYSCMDSIESFLVLGHRDKLIVESISGNGLLSASIIIVPSPYSGVLAGIGSVKCVSKDVVLCSAVPLENREANDVDLIIIEGRLNSGKFTFARFFDPCASRPPRANQFFFASLTDFSAESKCLMDFVVMANYSSPDIGIAGRLGPDGEFQTFYIDNDEGLAQLPLQQGELTYPIGMAIDFTATVPIPDSQDPLQTGPFPPAPILWVFTNSGHLCPFNMINTSEKPRKWPFMLNDSAADLDRGSSPSNFADSEGDVPDKFISSLRSNQSINTRSTISDEEEDEVSEYRSSLSSSAAVDEATDNDSVIVVNSSDVKRIEAVAVKPVVSISKPLDKPPPVVAAEPSRPVTYEAKDQVDKKLAESERSRMPIAPTATVEEVCMEAVDLGPYQNIMLAEVLKTRESMNADIVALKQLHQANNSLLHEHSSKYFSKVDELLKYADNIDGIVNSSEKTLGLLLKKVKDVMGGVDESRLQLEQTRAAWRCIKYDQRINWDERAKTLLGQVDELFSKIDLFSQSAESLKQENAKATTAAFHRELIADLQSIIVYLSVLFATPSDSAVGVTWPENGLREMNMSTDSLLIQMNRLNIEKTAEDYNDIGAKILHAAKARGARLLIPQPKLPEVAKSEPSSLSSLDEDFISKFSQSISIKSDVPAFSESITKPATLLTKDAAHKPALPAPKPAVPAQPVIFTAPATLQPANEIKLNLATSVPKELISKLQQESLKYAQAQASPDSKPAQAAFSFASPPPQKPPSETSVNENLSPISFASLPIPEATKPKDSIAGSRPPQTETIPEAPSALPEISFGSLSFGGPVQKPAAEKVFPSIFKMPEPNEADKRESKPVEPFISAVKPEFAFSFGNNSEPKPPAVPALFTANSLSEASQAKQPASFGFSFGSVANTNGPEVASSAPKFGQTSSLPVFGSLSGAIPPAAIPSKPLGVAQGGSFSAFASQTAGTNAAGPGFSFATHAQQNPSATGTSFASFRPKEDEKTLPKNPSSSSSTFSFSGFRE